MSTQTTLDSTVNSLYLAFYGRPADPAGLKFWSQQLAASNGDLSAITQAFATSEEAQVRFGTDTVAGRIGEIYQALFNHAPDAAGLAYWTNAVEQGNASIADVSVAIMGGAQGVDQTLTAARQKAVDAFTALVEASGTQYSGYASVEAARILVRAVTADATPADVDVLVKAAVSFADTATKTPSVVDAIATGTTLLALFDTARGKGDPVALAQALADTAKAAAGNPVTLESLLRGGGMDQVLKVMPANATLKDVVAALAAGGLPAAIEVVYPTVPATPAPVPMFGLKLAFAHVTQEEEFDQLDDNVTNQAMADVTFTYTGRDLRANQHFEYSLDGTNWIETDIVVNAITNTVILKDIQLAPQIILNSVSNENVPVVPPLPVLPNFPIVPPLLVPPNFPIVTPTFSVTTISLRAVDSSGATTTPVTQNIVYDGYVATPMAILDLDSHYGQLGSDDDFVTNDGTLIVQNLESGATVDYLVQPQSLGLNGGVTIFGLVSVPVATDEWTKTPVYQQGENTVWVRVTDPAGNQALTSVTFTLDTEAPDTPTIELHSAGNNGVTTSGLIDITGLDEDTATAWEYTINDGKSWTYGGTNDGTGTGTFELSNIGETSVQVRQYDTAGNIGKASSELDFTLEAGPPLLFSVSSTGLMLESPVAGAIFLNAGSGDAQVMSTETDGNAIVGTVTIGEQFTLSSGTFKVVPAQGASAVDASGTIYALGSAGQNFISNAQYAFGFGGSDILMGTIGSDHLYGGDGNDFIQAGQGNDVIDGGAGNDEITGGLGADQITVSAGVDTLLYSSTADSNMSGISAPSFDTVTVGIEGLVKFDFNYSATNVFSYETDHAITDTVETLFLKLNEGFNAVNASGHDAVLFETAIGQLLVVNNGDTVIDGNDYAILIVGSGNAWSDGQGNVYFGSPS